MHPVTDVLVNPSLQMHWFDARMRVLLASQEVQLSATPTQETQGEVQIRGVLIQTDAPFSIKPDPQGHFKFCESKMRLVVGLQEAQLVDADWQVAHL
jgi:hypothetical protein